MARKVLIIEGTPAILEIMKDVFEGCGYSVSGALTGEEGLNKSVSESPDLVILNTILPDTDGFEICRKIKEKISPAGLKIMMVTRVAGTIDAIKARKMGADDYCAKTEDISHIVKAADRLMQKD